MGNPIYKITLLTLVLSLWVFGGYSQSNEPDFEDLSWLEGIWYKNNNKAGQQSTEKWVKISDTLYEGKGVTIRGVDTVFVEQLKIIRENNKTYYIAEVAENKYPVYFEITALSSMGFIAINEDHDFPKRIEYQRKDPGFTAIVSDDHKSITFDFNKNSIR